MKTRLDVDTPDEAPTPRSRKRSCAAQNQPHRDAGPTLLRLASVESHHHFEPSRRPMRLMPTSRHGQACLRANNEDLTLLIQAVERARSLLKHRCDRRPGAGAH